MDEAASAWWALAQAPRLGPVRLKALHAHWGEAAKALEAGPERWHRELGLPAPVAAAAHRQAARALPEGRRRVREAASAGYAVLHPEHAAYPPLLAHLPDPPPLLYLGGTLPPTCVAQVGAARVVAVVGTRRASHWGLTFTRTLAARLAEAGVVVVSGLALGIDGAAHEGALEAGTGTTVAVLGSGLASVHPRRHLGLARRITAGGGALLSEEPPDAPARPEAFPRRNRIIAGLVQGVAVIEAGESSGAGITANLANDYGRTVFAVPRRPDLAVGKGTFALIRDGAVPLAGPGTILAEFDWAKDGSASGGEAGPGPHPHLRRALQRDGALSEAELSVHEPDPARLLRALTELELAGLARRDGAGRWHVHPDAPARR